MVYASLYAVRHLRQLSRRQLRFLESRSMEIVCFHSLVFSTEFSVRIPSVVFDRLAGRTCYIALPEQVEYSQGGGKIDLILIVGIVGVAIRLAYPDTFIPCFGLCFSVCPSVLLGYSLRHTLSLRDTFPHKSTLFLLTVGCMGFTAIEAWCYADWQKSPYMMTLITSMVMFLLFTRCNFGVNKTANFIAALGKDCSLGVYIIHPIVISLLGDSFGDNSWIIQPWYVFILSTIIVYGYNHISTSWIVR